MRPLRGYFPPEPHTVGALSLLDVRQVSATNYPGFRSVKRGEHLIEAGPEPSTLVV
jgi:hypothetical protein